MAEQKGKIKQGKDGAKPKKAHKAGRGDGRRAAYSRYELEGRREKNKARNLRREQRRQDAKRIKRAKRALVGKPAKGSGRAARRPGG